LEALFSDRDWRIADFIYVGVCSVEPDKNLRAIGINRPCGSHRILSRESGEDFRWRDAQHRQSRIGKLDKYPLLLFAHDVHLLDSRHVEKSLPQFFGDAATRSCISWAVAPGHTAVTVSTLIVKEGSSARPK